MREEPLDALRSAWSSANKKDRVQLLREIRAEKAATKKARREERAVAAGMIPPREPGKVGWIAGLPIWHNHPHARPGWDVWGDEFPAPPGSIPTRRGQMRPSLTIRPIKKPISERAVLARCNRRLRLRDPFCQIHIARTHTEESRLGRYSMCDHQSNTIIRHSMNLEAFAREMGRWRPGNALPHEQER